MWKQILVCTLLVGGGLAAEAQERSTPRPSFFEEERRLNTPTEVEIREDREARQRSGFSATFLTDALNGVSDPGVAAESRNALTTVNITPARTTGTSELVPLGIFVRPPATR
ncbi:MAG: hypothetical protein RMK91_03980 [Pseudanabaenaceae cyanobacterium SKYGB_i_bin29]|nr:hypothetical protein [Pseudanabaenaceae cyanobacterium SKYG29]MDW8421002.1 hypothetical protein [Pseudanabaenaceae cyanobacterium SKYGB_i_bin29]